MSEQAASAQSASLQPTSSGTSEQPGSYAIGLGGRDDVSDTHIAWKAPRVTTGYAAPVALDDAAYFVKKNGLVQCVDVQSVELH